MVDLIKSLEIVLDEKEEALLKCLPESEQNKPITLWNYFETYNKVEMRYHGSRT